jgi:hypothetical protein
MRSDPPRPLDRERNTRPSGVTRRAVIAAYILLVLVLVAAFYADLLYFVALSFGSGVPASAPFAVLFLLAAVLSIPVVAGRFGLRRQELLSIYMIVLVGAPLVSFGVLGWMLPHSIYQQYTARALPEWEHTFLQHIPTWFTLTDTDAVEGFFHGRSSVPWALWRTPLAAWSSFLLGLVVASGCLVLLLRRQWISHERLTFPLAQIPLETVVESRRRPGVARLPVSSWFWVGLVLSFGVNFLNSLAARVPVIPSIPLGPVAIVRWQRVGPLAGLGEIDLVLWPWLIAVAYLIPKELSFSCWFFWLVRVALTVLAVAAGATPERPEEWFRNDFPAPYHQSVGAVLALAGWVLWTGRKHIARALSIAFSRQSGRADSDEPVPYRYVLVLLALSTGWLVYFCWLAGARVTVGAAIIALILMFYLVWARLRAETGMGFIPFGLNVNDIMVIPFGSAVFRPREIVMLLSARWSYFPGFGESLEVVTGNMLESMKVADAARVRTRPLIAAMAGGFLIALLVGIFITLTGIYHYGFYGLRCSNPNFWLESQLRWDGVHIFNYLTNPSRFDLYGTLAITAGAVVTVSLAMLRLRFWWWPLHPVGYLAANVWGMHWYYMPFFVGWLAKTLVIRYSGLRLYRQTVPLAIGLVGGDLLNQVVWALTAIVTRGTV